MPNTNHFSGFEAMLSNKKSASFVVKLALFLVKIDSFLRGLQIGLRIYFFLLAGTDCTLDYFLDFHQRNNHYRA